MPTLSKKTKQIFIFSLTALVIFSLTLANVFYANLGRAQEEPAVSESPSPVPSDIPSATPSPLASPTPSETLTPTPSETPSPTPTPSETPTPTPSETPSPTPTETPTPTAICGNGIIEAEEQCDDSNLVDGDGCNSVCLKELIVPNDVGTGFDLNFSDNERPVVQAIWQMNQATSTSDQGKDDSLTDGAQFMPSGQYQVDKTIEICAVVSDPDGLADLANVSSQIYYPENIYLGPNRLSSQPGCGQAKEEWFNMTALEPSQGLELFCQQVRNNNANLPSFKTGNDFATLCGPAGDLTKETSRVFCGQNRLAYQDPAGEYRVKVAGLDQKKSVGVLENSFKYLELVAFEIDFGIIDYGSMRLNSPKILLGNDVFLTNDGRPTLRNIGNTRLEISIKQNDMGLGQSETGWNLTYQARVGQDASFTNYWPEAWATLVNSMNLGETSQLDLAIEVLKFPEIVAGEHYAGKLSLNAVAAPQLVCAE